MIRRWWRRLLWWILGAFLGLVMFSLALVLLFRWVDPPMSAVMLQHWVGGLVSGTRARPYVRHEWVEWDEISPEVALAVIAGEDQRFPDHHGFDLHEIHKAIAEYRSGDRLRGASTLSQQTAKNLFLWQGRDYLRKGLEAWFTVLIETFWSKQRILECYLNIAQFGPDTFGVGAASWQYFDRPAEALDTRRASLLAAVLPSPERYRLASPSTYVRKRAAWIRTQMRNLGGVRYLATLSH